MYLKSTAMVSFIQSMSEIIHTPAFTTAMAKSRIQTEEESKEALAKAEAKRQRKADKLKKKGGF